MPTPSAIVTQARTWKGTRFHHQGRVKVTATHKGGCDCIGLVLGVAAELSLTTRNSSGMLLSYLDEKGYGRVPDGFRLRAMLETHLHTIPVSTIAPGDILLFRFDANPQHVGIVSDYGEGLGIIHCYAQAREVVEHRLDAVWQARIVAAYRFQEI